MKSFSEFLSESGEYVERRGHSGFKQYKNHPTASPEFFDKEDGLKALKDAQRKHPDKKQWFAASLGISYHDPQLRGRIISGNPPDHVKHLHHDKHFSAAWDHMKGVEHKAFNLSRKSGI